MPNLRSFTTLLPTSYHMNSQHQKNKKQKKPQSQKHSHYTFSIYYAFQISCSKHSAGAVCPLP